MAGLQFTLAIMKPHIVKNPVFLDGIRNEIFGSNFKIVKSRRTLISPKQAESFYEEHKGKFFYNRLVTFMTSGESDLYILAKENAIKDWRQLMGPTKVFKAQFEAPESIRGKFGLSDTRNATHGSDIGHQFKKLAAECVYCIAALICDTRTDVIEILLTNI